MESPDIHVTNKISKTRHITMLLLIIRTPLITHSTGGEREREREQILVTEITY